MPDIAHHIEQVAGFQVAGVHAGLKKTGALDFALIVSDRPCTAAGVFTTNKVKAAPVLLNQHRLQANPGGIRAIAVNTVSANACTGATGMQNAQTMAAMVGAQLNIDPDAVLVMSTGVIGTQLPMDKIQSGIERSAAALGDDWQATADAIRTTDTRPKQASVSVQHAQGTYTIAGITKGSGMIAPNMATTLGIIVTDVQLTLEQARQTLQFANHHSYNCMVVDGDTSTNDMIILLANGASGITLDKAALRQFQTALMGLMIDMAQQVVRDGEGVTKFITLDIRGMDSTEDAHQIARTIATSALVKTAFYGNDANWGRIIAAAGRAGVAFNPDTARLWMAAGEKPTISHDAQRGDDTPPDSVLLFENGTPTPYDEAEASRIIRHDSLYVTLDGGAGCGAATVWTCDLSHDYVSINADYRT